jgi:hypothetical protein
MPGWYFTVFTARMVAIITEVKLSATYCDYIQPPTPQITPDSSAANESRHLT